MHGKIIIYTQGDFAKAVQECEKTKTQPKTGQPRRRDFIWNLIQRQTLTTQMNTMKRNQPHQILIQS